jgi:tRNA pseudouridine38-40 synthase
VHVVVQGDGFLYNMVRIIGGTLVEVGRGSMPVDVVDRVLASGRRREAGPTLPAQGLWLEWVAYRP